MKCPNCNTENPTGTIFCSTCGTKLSSLLNLRSNTSSISRMIFCTTCGTKLSSDDIFCQNCGTRVMENAEEDIEDTIPTNTEITETTETPIPVNTTDDTTESDDDLYFDSFDWLSSDGYCYFYMVFYNSNKQKDKAMAEKVYNYCKEHFEWFTTNDNDCNEYGDYFVCENGTISNSGSNNGLSITPSSDFIEFIFNKFNPADMMVQNIQDYSCRNYGDNYVQIFEGNNGSIENVLNEQFGGGVDFDFFIDSSYGYPFKQNSFKKLYPVFKNKKNGTLYTACTPIEVHACNESTNWICDIVNGSECIFKFEGAEALDKNGNNTSSLFKIASFNMNNCWDSPASLLEGDIEEEDDDWDNFEFLELKEENLGC